jgi:hypothetical protein
MFQFLSVVISVVHAVSSKFVFVEKITQDYPYNCEVAPLICLKKLGWVHDKQHTNAVVNLCSD